MIREPNDQELVAYVCAIQPELDEPAAARLVSLDPVIREGIAQAYQHQRDRAESLLELHLELEGIQA